MTLDVTFIPKEKITAAMEMMKALVEQSKPDWTSRIYRKFVRLTRGERVWAARKCAIKLGVPGAQIDAALTLLEIPTP
jgi:hypothetical protein